MINVFDQHWVVFVGLINQDWSSSWSASISWGRFQNSPTKEVKPTREKRTSTCTGPNVVFTKCVGVNVCEDMTQLWCGGSLAISFSNRCGLIRQNKPELDRHVRRRAESPRVQILFGSSQSVSVSVPSYSSFIREQNRRRTEKSLRFRGWTAVFKSLLNKSFHEVRSDIYPLSSRSVQYYFAGSAEFKRDQTDEMNFNITYWMKRCIARGFAECFVFLFCLK